MHLLGFLPRLFTEQAGGTEEQDEYECCKNESIRPAGIQVAIAEGGKQTDQESAQHAAGDISDTAEDCRCEGLQTCAEAHEPPGCVVVQTRDAKLVSLLEIVTPPWRFKKDR